jgi:membrane-associated phospholipid phosphatase
MQPEPTGPRVTLPTHTTSSQRPSSLALRYGRPWREIFVSLFRAPRQGTPRGWSGTMTLLAFAGIALALLATLIDEAAIRAVLQDGSALRAFAAAITDLGQSQWYLVPAFLTVLALALADWSRRTLRARSRMSLFFGQAAFAFGAVALSGLLVNIFKLIFGRARPRLLDEVGIFGTDPFSLSHLYQSFPSGHSTTAGALAMIMILWMPRLWPLWLALGALLAGTRLSTIAHYPSDIIAGFTLGALYTLHLARWLAVRGRAFRIREGALLPSVRHANGLRRR